MEKHPVALIPIATYDQAAVDTAVLQGVDLLGNFFTQTNFGIVHVA